MIDFFIHLNDGHSCFAIAIQNGEEYWRGPSVFWQKRGMHVESTEFGFFKHFFAHNLSPKPNHDQINLLAFCINKLVSSFFQFVSNNEPKLPPEKVNSY